MWYSSTRTKRNYIATSNCASRTQLKEHKLAEREREREGGRVEWGGGGGERRERERRNMIQQLIGKVCIAIENTHNTHIERIRERERGGQTDRQTETDIHKHRHRDTDRHRQTERQKERACDGEWLERHKIHL